MGTRIWQLLLVIAPSLLLAPAARADAVSDARAFAAKMSAPAAPWAGPTTGPKALPGKTIVYISTDQNNGGARGVGESVKEAADAIGWKYRLLDGQGSVSGRTSAMSQAIATKPDVIVLGAIDATEQSSALEDAAKQGIVLIGWHAVAHSGPAPKLSLFTNITTDPLEVARAAASLPCAETNGKAGVVIFTDSTYEIAVRKARAMEALIKECGDSKVLEFVDTPLAESSTRMPQLTTSLLQKYGKSWTHSLSINDLTFDFMAPSLAAAGIPGDGAPLAVSAGDGSGAAFQRIRQKEYQQATVAEPLRLHGWQIVDEANRALSKQKDSGFVAPAHLFTAANIGSDGGPKDNYDPDNNYAAIYKKIWAGQ
ncbi:substrate-binding domain-containing protein [Bosea minatitlanensis]|uniref:Substrate-binding domain-containing protein n=1 Tax=Bosea minatitlanensis TaxID=128782 RepID=A0ABW0F962_9HYPH|nr:substrate-binding domain-containing protein [Bosea minatitlanensis]MCT4494904.1 substrate-binding domain-containing protein [Bosea minatitlanensis]